MRTCQTIVGCALAGTLLVLLVGCHPAPHGGPSPNNTVLQVTSPPNKTNFSNSAAWPTDGANHLQIAITFNAPVDQNSVASGKTVLVDSSAKNNAMVNIKWVSDTIVIITTLDTTDQLLHPRTTTDGYIRIRLIGTDSGNGTIRGQAGQALDGDADGAPGGDYSVGVSQIG